MKRLSTDDFKSYHARLDSLGIPTQQKSHYVKWVRYFLDYESKYAAGRSGQSLIDAFIAKLSSKGQSEGLCVQARKAVSLYLGLNEAESALSKASASNIKVHAPPESDGAAQAARQNRMATPESKPQAIEGNWAATIRAMESAISRRNYSKKTLSTYVMWVKRFGEYADHMPVAEITDEVAKGFLTDLAVKNDGVASTQNQAFNALLFLFRLVLKRDFALRPRRFVAGSLSARRVRSIAAADPVTTGSGEE